MTSVGSSTPPVPRMECALVGVSFVFMLAGVWVLPLVGRAGLAASHAAQNRLAFLLVWAGSGCCMFVAAAARRKRRGDVRGMGVFCCLQFLVGFLGASGAFGV